MLIEVLDHFGFVTDLPFEKMGILPKSCHRGILVYIVMKVIWGKFYASAF